MMGACCQASASGVGDAVAKAFAGSVGSRVVSLIERAGVAVGMGSASSVGATDEANAGEDVGVLVQAERMRPTDRTMINRLVHNCGIRRERSMERCGSLQTLLVAGSNAPGLLSECMGKSLPLRVK